MTVCATSSTASLHNAVLQLRKFVLYFCLVKLSVLQYNFQTFNHTAKDGITGGEVRLVSVHQLCHHSQTVKTIGLVHSLGHCISKNLYVGNNAIVNFYLQIDRIYFLVLYF